MRARALAPHAIPAAARPAGPSWRVLAAGWAAFVAAVLVVAAVVAVGAPGWLPAGERELANHPSLIADIFFNNLLLALIPLFGGWLAAGHVLAGRRRLAVAFGVLCVLIVARSLITIGAVGGGDPGWLVAAARWWLLEVGALAAASVTGAWLAGQPQLRDAHGPAAVRRALAIVLAALTAGALIEVLSA